jgi:hypothetical protein
MTPSRTDTLDAFVQQLVETSFTLMTIVEGMIRFQQSGASSADAPPIPDVLRDLLASTLTPLSKRPGDDGLTAATRVLGDALDLICSDIYIVDPSNMPRRERRAKRRGGH